MSLFKTSLYTSVSTGITFISGFIITKVIAVKGGPQGMAFLGQFQNFTTLFTLIASCAIINGVIKYIATHVNDKTAQQKVITNSITVTMISALFVSVFVIVFSKQLSFKSFNTNEYAVVYVLYGCLLTIIALNVIIAGIYNGLKYIKQLTIINITGSLSGILITLILSNYFGIKGILASSSFIALITFCLNLYFIKNISGYKWSPSVKAFDGKVLKNLFAFTLMNIVSGILTPLSQLIVRNTIIKTLSEEQAGQWQAVTKISDYYLSFITTVLGVYYLPKLAELTKKEEIKNEIKKSYKIVMPVVILLALVIFICKPLIVNILFTPAFTAMLPLFKFQLLGDIFKISSWLFAFLMISKALTKTFIITEILFASSLVFLSILFIKNFGVLGATYAFCVNYALYALTMFFLIKHYLNGKSLS